MTPLPQRPPAPAATAADQVEALDRAGRWRLILGKAAQPSLAALGATGGRALDGSLLELDAALDVIYENERGDDGASGAARSASLARSAPKLARWLGDIRKYFPRDVVAVIQEDAIERRGLKQLLFEPETLGQITPSVELAATILSLKGLIPEQTLETARRVVRAVADEIVRRLRSSIERSIRGALDRSRTSPIARLANLDIRRTLRHNLRNYDRDRKAMVVERLFFHARKQQAFEWTVIVCLDQSGSMAPSLVYGAVTASILASLRAIKTHLVVFDTEVVDLTDVCDDPVEVLFGVHLGGGTDINRAVGYCQELVTTPRKTLFLLITDLCEGGDATSLAQRLEQMVGSGVRAACLLALADDGAPAFDHAMARRVRGMGVPTFACTPTLLPELLEAALKGDDLARFDKP
jgi:hypothetical protein